MFGMEYLIEIKQKINIKQKTVLMCEFFLHMEHVAGLFFLKEYQFHCL